MAEVNKMEEQQDKARLVLGTMLDYLGLEADLTTELKGNKLSIKIASEEAGRIIGRRGVTLESLQLLLNRIMFKGNEDAPMISLDIDGYSRGNNGRERRNNSGGGERSGNGEARSNGGERRSGGRRDNNRRNGGGRRGDSVPEEQLRMLALDKSKEVKRWGEDIELAPMNAHDRRIIHINLKDDKEIETRSEGEGAMKKVIISLKKSSTEEN